ncbi:SDR family NAD(P)-dependent oxidoreductase [Myxococcota bacterium]|nr:SDR family NAD(P)-dependent oxidoreductase [Myxococcota bacterium]
MSLSLEGRVAIVTGAAHGLGRCHAINLAQRGAKIVVNDIGADDAGGGRNESPAEQVVEEIKAAGGEAVAHFGDVADWNDAQALVQRAVDTYGDLHILINNAGFTRDATIFNMTEQDFDDVVRVHLKGHFAVSKFAMTHWRNQSKQAGGPIFGRLISTASESWLFGTPGQPNYAPAKAGIVSLTMGLAQMGLRYGVTANVVMPRARTRMTLKGAMGAMFEKPEEGFDNFDPENSSPLFVYLCTPEAGHISGELFLIWGQATSVWKRPEPYAVYETDDIWTVERLHEVYGPHFESRQVVTDGFTVPAM